MELGTPDPDRLRKACGKSSAVVLYCYGDRATPVWWEKHAAALSRLDRLSVYQVDDASCQALAGLAETNMVQVTIEAGEAWVSAGTESIQIVPRPL